MSLSHAIGNFKFPYQQPKDEIIQEIAKGKGEYDNKCDNTYWRYRKCTYRRDKAH